MIALFELRYGHARSDRRSESDRLLAEFLAPGIAVLPFEAEDAAHAGDIRADLESKGRPIGHYDYLIAAQARRRGATLRDGKRPRVRARAGVVGGGLDDVMDAAAVAAENDDAAEGPWALPEGWCWVPLGEIVDIHDHRRRPIKAEDRQTRIVGKSSDGIVSVLWSDRTGRTN